MQVRDITPGTCCIGVWGPSARDVVQSLSDEDFSNEAFGFFNARYAYLRGGSGDGPSAFVRRGTRVGDLHDIRHGIATVGSRYGRRATVRRRGGWPCRLQLLAHREGLPCLWGTDMTTEHDPYEAGLGFAVKADKGGFIEARRWRNEKRPDRAGQAGLHGARRS